MGTNSVYCAGETGILENIQHIELQINKVLLKEPLLLWSCGLMRHVLDWEVCGSNPREYGSF